MNLTEEQIERYSRQILLPDVGGAGQQKLLNARVLIIGAGGLGAPVALYLAGAGVGTIGLADGDAVDLSNLQRQILHFTEDLGRPKTQSEADKLCRLNPDVRVVTHPQRVTAANAVDLVSEYDFVIDGTDNFPAKFLINDACVLAGKPFSHAGILRLDGQTLTVLPRRTACFRCVFEEPPPPGAVPSCSQAGILGPVAGLIGCVQATEALKFILGLEDGLLAGRLLVMNARTMTFRTVTLKQNPACRVCGKNPTITAPEDYEQKACDLSAR